MTPRRCIHTLLFGVAFVLATIATASAQSVGDAVLEIMVRPVPRDGSPSRARAWDTHERPKGQADSTYLFAGRSVDGTESLCSAGSSEVTGRSLDDLVSRHLYVWKITSRAVGLTDRGISFDVEWVRYASDTGTRPVASGRSTLVLAEGRRHVLDLVHATGASSQCDAGSVVLDVEARLRDDPTLTDRLIRYDLWLVHTAPTGDKRTSHVIQTGVHGVQLPFVFSPVRLPVPSSALPQIAFDATVRVSGDLRGRILRDGTVAVELVTSRRAALEQRGAGPVTQIEGGQGRKVLQLASGETLAIELPALAGGATTVVGPNASRGELSARGGVTWAGTGGPQDAVSLADGKLTVSFTRLFEGHKLSILLRAQFVE
jgi:hypothetical protein